MPKPSIIKNPTKTALYLPKDLLADAKAIAAKQGVSMSHLVSTLLQAQSPDLCKFRVFADFTVADHQEIATVAEEMGMTVEDLVRTATYQFIDANRK